MKHILTGTVVKGRGESGRRLRQCASVLAAHGLEFPPLYFGTLNVRMLTPFATPDWPDILWITPRELDSVAPINVAGQKYRECWEFVPVTAINEQPISAFIYRTTTNYHGDSVIELVAPDLARLFSVREGTLIKIELNDGMEA